MEWEDNGAWDGNLQNLLGDPLVQGPKSLVNTSPLSELSGLALVFTTGIGFSSIESRDASQVREPV